MWRERKCCEVRNFIYLFPGQRKVRGDERGERRGEEREGK